MFLQFCGVLSGVILQGQSLQGSPVCVPDFQAHRASSKATGLFLTKFKVIKATSINVIEPIEAVAVW